MENAEASRQYPLTSLSPETGAFQALLPHGIKADISVPICWPGEDAVLTLNRIHGADKQTDLDRITKDITHDTILSKASVLALVDAVAAAVAANMQ